MAQQNTTGTTSAATGAGGSAQSSACTSTRTAGGSGSTTTGGGSGGCGTTTSGAAGPQVGLKTYLAEIEKEEQLQHQLAMMMAAAAMPTLSEPYLAKETNIKRLCLLSCLLLLFIFFKF
jgi:hypothetical protein